MKALFDSGFGGKASPIYAATRRTPAAAVLVKTRGFMNPASLNASPI